MVNVDELPKKDHHGGRTISSTISYTHIETAVPKFSSLFHIMSVSYEIIVLVSLTDARDCASLEPTSQKQPTLMGISKTSQIQNARPPNPIGLLFLFLIWRPTHITPQTP